MNVKEFFRRMTKKKVTVVCLVLFVLIILMVLLAPLIAPYGADQQDPYSRNLAPSLQHLCGTDNLGRDIVSRLLYGGPVSLTLGFVGTIVTTIIGGIIGIIAAYYGGKVDNVIMRVLDVFMAIPPMLLAMAIVAALGTGIFNTMLAVIISGIPGKARAARGPVLQLKGPASESGMGCHADSGPSVHPGLPLAGTGSRRHDDADSAVPEHRGRWRTRRSGPEAERLKGGEE